jgi:hypothetical protein
MPPEPTAGRRIRQGEKPPLNEQLKDVKRKPLAKGEEAVPEPKTESKAKKSV